MAEAKDKYVTAVGFVQFDPNVRDANGKTVTDVTLKAPGGDGVLVRVSIWEELDVEGALGRPIEKSDFVAVDGKFSVNSWEDKDTGEKRSQPQISAYTLNVNGVRITKADREVVTAASNTSF